MSSTIFSIRCDSRTKAVESLAKESWKSDHDEAMFALDVEKFVDECLDQYDFLREQWEYALQIAVDGSLECGNNLGTLLIDIFDRSLLAFGHAETLVMQAESCGHSIDGAREFRRAIVETKKIRHRIKKSWPFDNMEGMENAIRCYREGNCKNIDEIIDELQGSNSGDC